MKTMDTYGKIQFRADRPIAYRSLLIFACTMSTILSFFASPAMAAAEPNAPAIADANDPNTPKAPPQNTALEPNQPPKPTIDDAALDPAVSQLTPKSARRDWLIAGLPKSDIAREIWRERITVPQNDEAEDKKMQLQQLIDRIRSIEFKPQEPPHEPIIVFDQTPPVEPNTASVRPADQNQPEAQPKHTPYRKAKPPTVSDDTLKILLSQLEQPELLKNPFELGEILFNARRLEEAAVCYRQALTRIDPNQPDPTQKRPWIMFQIGNCLRKDYPENAIEAYSQLITEHAGSFWAEPAKAQAGLIAWRQKDKPRILIEQSRPKPVQTGLPIGLIKNQKTEALTEPDKREQTQNK